MRNLIYGIVCSLLFFSLSVQAQNYYVLKVKGQVKANDQPLKVKQKLSPDTKLKFAGPDDFVFVIAPGKGHYILACCSSVHSPSGNNEILTNLQEALVPPAKFYSTSSRGQQWDSKVFLNTYDLRTFFAEDLMLYQEIGLRVNTSNLPMDSNNRFWLEWKSPDGTSGALPLPFAGDKFFIRAKDFPKSVHKSGMPLSCELLYKTADGEQGKLAGQFVLVLPHAKSLKKELRTLGKSEKPISAREFYDQHALRYLELNYGHHLESDVWPLIEKSVK